MCHHLLAGGYLYVEETMRYLSTLLLLLLGGCTALPPNLEPLHHFDLGRYLGTWYEIARLDHSFERGLSRVSAQYSLLENGKIRVINQGYSETKDKWKKAVGTATFVGETDKGHLKVSFFGPFYSSYVILDLDRKSYQYALICGPTRDYLWILARKPTLDAKKTRELVDKAASMGFAVENLIYVTHE